MKKTLQLVFITLIVNTSFAQTGPGGVGDDTNNVLWLRSNDLSLNDGDDITTWSDFTTNSNDVSQSDTNFKPVFKTNIINGYPVVRFNKSNGRIRKNNFNNFPSTEITAIYVNKNDGESEDGILSYASSSNNNDFLLFGSDNLDPHIKGSYKPSNIAFNDNNWYIANTSWKSSGGTLEVWKDGSKGFSDVLKDGVNIAGDGCLAIAGEQDAIDGNYDSSQAHFGDFTEIILYDIFLNDAQQIIVSNYLSAKYATSLASNDYYLQDNNANGDYDFNVAGIGQANDGSSHIDSQGEGVIRINTPSSISNNDYLFWGENNKNNSYFFKSTTDNTLRLDATWRISKNQDLGTVSINIDKIDLSGMTTCSQLKIIVSSSNTFTTKTSYDLILAGGVYTATNVNFNDGDYFSIEFATNLGYTGPGGVGNCETIPLWLRAEDITVADGSDINLWNDFSGNNNNVSQTDTSFQPIFQENIINSYPVVRFNKSNNRLIKENFNEFPSGEITAIYVNKNDSESSDGILSYASSEHNNDFLLYDSNSLYPHRPNSVNSGAVLNDNNWHSANTSWKSEGREVNVWKDGDDVFTGSSSTSYKNSITKNGCLAIAAEQDAVNASYDSGQTHNGDFTEIILYNYALNDAKQIIVSNYLSAKYDYTLLANNFYTQDNSGNGNFDFDVAGIGQAVDGSNHTDSQGTGVVRINTPSALADDDFLFWGEETKNPTYDFTTSSEYTERLNSKWRVSKRNDLGTVSVNIKDTDIDLSGKTTCTGLKLIVSNTSDFNTKTSYNMTLASGVYTATDVNFTDGDYFTFEYFDKIVVDGTKFYNGSGNSNVPSVLDGCYKLLVKDTADGTLPLTEDCIVREVEVESGGNLVVNTGLNFEITNNLQLDGDIRLIGNASLNQTHTGTSQVTGNGKLYMDKTSNLTNVYQSGFWSSPVVTSGNTYTITDAMKDGTTPTNETSTPLDINFVSGYDGANGSPISISNYWLAKLTNALAWNIHRDENTSYSPTEGYNMKSSGANHQNFTFVGKPNDGDYNSTITSGNSSLLGNPYPSAMDADEFLNDNNTIFDTLYFWDGIVDDSNSHVRSEYNGGYATYNGTTGVAYNGGEQPNGIISVGQGFFVDATADGTIVFNNSHRIFNLSAPFYARTNATAILRIGMDFETDNNDNFHRQLAIGFNGTTNEFESQYDAIMYDMHPSDFALKVLNNTNDFVITGIENFNETIEIPLHVRLDQNRNITFNIDAMEHFSPNNIYLKDNVTNLYHNLQSNVNLNLDAGNYNDRFSVVFRNSVANINDIIKNNTIKIIDNGNDILIESNLTIKQITIYNTLGQTLISTITNNTKTSIPNQIDKGQIIFIKISLINGQEFTKKVIKK